MPSLYSAGTLSSFQILLKSNCCIIVCFDCWYLVWPRRFPIQIQLMSLKSLFVLVPSSLLVVLQMVCLVVYSELAYSVVAQCSVHLNSCYWVVVSAFPSLSLTGLSVCWNIPGSFLVSTIIQIFHIISFPSNLLCFPNIYAYSLSLPNIGGCRTLPRFLF
jgi:hypothetical protein